MMPSNEHSSDDAHLHHPSSSSSSVRPNAGANFLNNSHAMLSMLSAPGTFFQQQQSWLNGENLMNSIHRMNNHRPTSSLSPPTTNHKQSSPSPNLCSSMLPNHRVTPNSSRNLKSPVISSNQLLPTTIPQDPRLWCRDDVICWFEWIENEFSLSEIQTDSFVMNGKALCMLTKEDFRERIPNAGDVIYNTLQLIVRDGTSYATLAYSRPSIAAADYYSEKNVGGTGSENRPYFPVYSSPHYHQRQYRPSEKQSLNHKGASDSNELCAPTANFVLSPTPSSDSGNHSEANSPKRAHSRNDDSPSEDLASATDVQKSVRKSCNSTPKFTFSDDYLSDMDEYGCNDEEATSLVDDGQMASRIPCNNQKPTCNKIPTITMQTNHMDNSCLKSTQEDFMNQRDTLSSGRLLWDFLQQLLNDNEQRYSQCIVWRNREHRIFKIVDPQGLAKLWGIHKNHLNMNFDKMSRALRYYYRVNILRKEQGERHCYRFLRHPAELRNCRQKALLNIPPKNAPEIIVPRKNTSVFPTSQTIAEAHVENESQCQALNLRVKNEPDSPM